MGSAATAGVAFDETAVFVRCFEGLSDPRQREKVRCHLKEILLLCLVAVLTGADTITEIALSGGQKLEFLRRFLLCRDGTLTHDHLGDILATLDSEAFQRCFVAWVAARTGLPEGAVAIDGKIVRPLAP